MSTPRRTRVGSAIWRYSSAASSSSIATHEASRAGALFHDIGKIGIPSDILQKPGPLTDEEFEIVEEPP